jgi:hypothetical protein
MRQIFGWLFGLCSIIALSVSVLFFRRGIVYDLGVRRFSTILTSGVIVLLALVFAMAWWTTWKARPTARAWGITASLANLFGPLSLMYFRRQPLTDSRWKVIAFSTLALIVYAWPNSYKDSLNAE